tara:strand:+ start:140 stop:370 length:231 start_codon:yes stop_codon:yes gene_type:complete
MKTFQEHLDVLFDEKLIAEKDNICDISIDKLKSSVMKKMHKDKCGGKEKDSAIHRAGKRAGLSRKDRDALYNEREK